VHVNRSFRLVPFVLATMLGLAACGEGGDSATVAAPPAAEQSMPPAPEPTQSDTPTPTESVSPSADVEKVSANDATEDEIAGAFEAAGVPNAKKWADEVVEYRPYPKDDPTFAKLRTKLAKYKPGEGVVDKIVSVLEP
jgi:hypothetical protein